MQGRPCRVPRPNDPEDGLIDLRWSAKMSWIILFLAGLLEIGWAIGLKYTHGFTRLWPTIGTLSMVVASMALLAVALRTLPLGTAYAVWTGIGTVGTATVGMVVFGEPATALRLACIAMIVCGIAGLKLLTP
jgi:quaternary ammonium compound-resistance protein SugE